MRPNKTQLFVLGNGPSLRGFDFAKFAGVKTLGMNAAYRYWRRIDWRPTHYCCLDDALIDTHAYAIKELIDEGRIESFFLTARILSYHPELKSDSRIRYLDEFVRHWYRVRGQGFGLKFSPHIAFKTASQSLLTTGAYSVRYAAMLGYESIRLLGVDLDYRPIESTSSLGGTRLIIDSTPAENPNYFFSDYQQAGDEFNVPNPAEHGRELHLHAFISLRDDFIANRLPVRISTATSSSKLFSEAILPFEPFGIEPTPTYKSTSASLLLRVKSAKHLFALLWLWRQPAFFPRLGASNNIPVDLLVQGDLEQGKEVSKQVKKYMRRYPAVRQCFNTIRFGKCNSRVRSSDVDEHVIDDEMVPLHCDWLNILLSRFAPENLTIELNDRHHTLESVNIERYKETRSLFLRSPRVRRNVLALMADAAAPDLRMLLSTRQND